MFQHSSSLTSCYNFRFGSVSVTAAFRRTCLLTVPAFEEECGARQSLRGSKEIQGERILHISALLLAVMPATSTDSSLPPFKITQLVIARTCSSIQGNQVGATITADGLWCYGIGCQKANSRSNPSPLLCHARATNPCTGTKTHYD